MTHANIPSTAGLTSTIPLAGAEHGRLVVEGGTGALEVLAGPSPDALLDATFVGDRPHVRASDGEVVMTYPTGLVAWFTRRFGQSGASGLNGVWTAST